VTALFKDEPAYHVFQATAQDVWDALTRPGWTRKYGYRTLVKFDPRPGGIYLAYASGRRYGQRAGDLIISARVRRGGRIRRLELGPERPEDAAGNGQAADRLARPATPRSRGEDRWHRLS
jgi:hypothetical protein